MLNNNNDSALTNDCVNSLYTHYLSMYQERYTRTFFFIVTWSHISYWRKTVNYLGGILIERGLKSQEQFLQEKNYRSGTPAMILQVQQCTVENTDSLEVY